MSMTRQYACDLCGKAFLNASTAVAVFHSGKDHIELKPLSSDGCGHHLCNECVEGLKRLFAGKAVAP